MLIDWFTVGAQILNFVVLVFLLKRFLYKPILNAIDAREKRVAAELADADLKLSEVHKSRDELQAKSTRFDEERGALRATAISDAKIEAQRLLDNARQAADALTLQRNLALQSDTTKLSDELSRLAAAESINIARGVLKDLAGVDLQARICEVFARRLRAIDSKKKESLGILLTSPAGNAVVASSFELSSGDKMTIQTALNESFSANIHLHFETSSNAIGGIELSVGGQRLSWTIADYLRTLEEKFAALLSAQNVPSGISAATSVGSSPFAIAEPPPAVNELNREAPAAAA
jgi:F-type H+-transporting ATPase subunit b